MSRTQPAPLHAFWLFFPAAAILGALVVPLSVYTVQSGTGWPPGLLGAGHGHELVFGFALALIAGYTLGPQPRPTLLLLLALWLAARASWLLMPDSAVAQILSPAFALVLARYAVPRFSAAKRWRNKAAGPLILLLCLLAVVFWLTRNARADSALPDPQRLMTTAVLGLLMLMTFIGGRIIAPAVAGTLEKKGRPLEARVQPRIEGALILLLAGTILLSLMPTPDALPGLTLMVCAGLILVRILRWQLWHCPERPDLLILALGYLWLAVGSAATGWHLLIGVSAIPALHLITVGALGTLSTSVMLRLAWQRAQRRYPPAWQVLGLGLLMAVAATARYRAGPEPFADPAGLWLSASAWSLAYGGVALQLLRLFPGTRKRRK